MKLLTESFSSASSLLSFGESLAQNFHGGEVLGLIGPLGVGKTVLVKGIAKGLGIQETITSASFVLVQSFLGRLWLHHVDFYRLPQKEAQRILSWTGYFENDSVLVVEWAEKALSSLPKNTLALQLSYAEEARKIEGRVPDQWQW